jgi:murein DD-endopeptidase MepM/ murein hydrolase activator NlpD
MEKKENLKHFPTISPVPRDRTWPSSLFGYRADPFTGKQAFHCGVDFAGRKGTPVYATADGVVAQAYRDLGLGQVIIIEHDIQGETEDGERYTRQGLYQTEYGHLDTFLVSPGERVKRGQQIGTMGNTGRSTGPHLHYAVRYQDHRRGQYKGYEDPAMFLLDEMPRDDQLADSWVPGKE